MELDELSQAIEELDGIDFSVSSEVEFGLDRVASLLAERLGLEVSKMPAAAPTLSEVLTAAARGTRNKELKEAFNEAADLADDVVLALKRVYEEELTEEQQDEVSQLVEELQDSLTKALPRAT